MGSLPAEERKIIVLQRKPKLDKQDKVRNQELSRKLTNPPKEKLKFAELKKRYTMSSLQQKNIGKPSTRLSSPDGPNLSNVKTFDGILLGKSKDPSPPIEKKFFRDDESDKQADSSTHNIYHGSE